MDGVATECDLCIVHNADASAWRDYIVQLVTRFVAKTGDPPLGIGSVDDASLTKTGHSLPRSSVVIVILSPAHLDFLRRHANVNYRTLVDTRSSKAMVLRCGVPCFGDLADQDKAVFSQFFGWSRVEEIDNGEPLTKELGRLLSRPPAQNMSNCRLKIPTPEPRRYSSASNPSSDRSSKSSNGSCTTANGDDSVFLEQPDGASKAPPFRVIPQTIRCEVRSMHMDYENPNHLSLISLSFS